MLNRLNVFVQIDSIANFFEGEVLAQIAAIEPDTNQLNLFELVPLGKISPAGQTIYEPFTFATPLADGQTVVVLIGIIRMVNGVEEIEWIVWDAYVEQGVLIVAFTTDIMDKMDELDSKCVMSVMTK